jgi:2,4-dienoyl-CoA reductase-like NADH-dependent reductase (Old Yellow Enzyme family)
MVDPIENRSRILFEILSAIRVAVPDPSFMLGVKLNAADFSKGKLIGEKDVQKLAVMLHNFGIDFIELSGGTYEECPWLEDKVILTL